jgi:hypothetical protein
MNERETSVSPHVVKNDDTTIELLDEPGKMKMLVDGKIQIPVTLHFLLTAPIFFTSDQALRKQKQ